MIRLFFAAALVLLFLASWIFLPAPNGAKVRRYRQTLRDGLFESQKLAWDWLTHPW